MKKGQKKLACPEDQLRLRQLAKDANKARKDTLKIGLGSAFRCSRKNLKGAGRPSTFGDIELELVRLVRVNGRCSFLEARDPSIPYGVANTDFFLWSIPALVASMKRRCEARGVTYHYSQKNGHVWVQRLVVKYSLEFITKTRLQKFDGMTVPETRRRILSSWIDWIR